MVDTPDPSNPAKELRALKLKPVTPSDAPHTLTLQQEIELMEAINELDQETMRTVLQVVKSAVPQIKDNNDDEIVLEMNEVPPDTLYVLYNFVKNVKAAKEAERLGRMPDGRVPLDPEQQKPIAQGAMPSASGGEVIRSTAADTTAVLPLRATSTQVGSSEQSVVVTHASVESMLDSPSPEASGIQEEVTEI